ncbi:hypothetical protein HN51_011749 [Arachis hypogaea]|nr:uncharacterized protein DS421_3g79390 [Arachis hypogaea]
MSLWRFNMSAMRCSTSSYPLSFPSHFIPSPMEPSHYSSKMFLQQNLNYAIDDQQKHTHIATTTSPYLSYPSIKLFNPNPNNDHYLNATIKNNDYSYAPSDEASFGEQNYYQSESDSCSSGDDEDEEVTLDEYFLIPDAKAKKQIEQLAVMVGLDTTEPAAVVLTQVVRVLKHLKGINSY